MLTTTNSLTAPSRFEAEGNQLNHKLLLFIIIIAGLVLRLFFMHNRYFSGDELGTLLWIKRDYQFLLTNFNSHWLTMNFYIIFIKLINHLSHGRAWALIAPSLISGIALIPIVYCLSLKVSAHRENALIAALLIAVNPFLIKYSVIIRSYSMMLFFATAALLIFIIWQRHKTWLNGIIFGGSLFLACLMHANALYHAVFIGALFFLIVDQKDKRNITIVLPTIIAAIATIYLYYPILGQILVYKQKFSQPPPAPINYLPELTRCFWGGGFYGVPSLILFGAGLWTSIKKGNNLLSLLALGIFIPIFLSSMAAVSVCKYAMGRFLITILPIIFLFIAEAISSISTHVKYTHTCAALLSIIILFTWLPHSKQVFNRQKVKPWPKVIHFLNKNLKINNFVIPLARSSRFNIGFLSLPERVDSKKLIKIDQFFGKTSKHPQSLKVMVVSDIPINGKRPLLKAGVLRIFSYTGSCRIIARSILMDIKNTLRDRIKAGYTPYYKAAIKLSSVLNLDNEIPRYICLYYESKMMKNPGNNIRTQRRNYYLHHHQIIELNAIKGMLPINWPSHLRTGKRKNSSIINF